MTTPGSNTKGFTVVETLVALGALGAIVSASMVAATHFQKMSILNARKSAFSTISANLMSTISQQYSWDKTIAQNPAMACIQTYPASCANDTKAKIILVNGDGLRLTDPGKQQQGFNPDGSVCDNFGTPNTSCLYQAEIIWSVHCTSATTCQYPEEKIEINFKYGGPEQINLNAFNVLPRARTNLGDNLSPTATCAKAGKVFVGFKNSVTDGDGKTFTADSTGCLPLIAFTGPTGPQGAMGARGATGAQGPRGPAGSNGSTIFLNTGGNGGGNGPGSGGEGGIIISGKPSPHPIASPGALCSLNGQTLSDGQSITLYASETVPFGQNCQSETRTCINGVLTGSYGATQCRTAPPQPCVVGGYALEDGETVELYGAPRCGVASSAPATCTNGQLTGPGAGFSYRYCYEAGSPLMVQFGSNVQKAEPLVFTSHEDGITFDILGMNSSPPYSPKRISWYRSPQYYFLVKPNNAGEVRGIDELFGDNTLGPDGKFAKDGYKALAKYDGTSVDAKTLLGPADTYITIEDPIYHKLRLWHDENFDGVAQKHELFTLKQMKVEVIDLNADPNFKEVDKYGNETTLKSVVKTTDGNYHLMFDVWFSYFRDNPPKKK
ncbi:hypothetical protein AZI87_17010 [Bdellovibrio bacteriovorus]|uniref:Prepilin-type N-terminal cleavage/methylation domain-containing protein n=1 Tax=Bdellovibrio bacteriovorus TaxID=959 RepID=A0A162G0J8_BDEBC|nr:collagen-like protein [Bdellovibrio bacteriovorus]KYG62960.1 hypothetical protein AZI87_17010 [Bdellovibrio bacteriovorus]